MKRFVLMLLGVLAVAVLGLTPTRSEAGPLKRLFGRGCSSCGTSQQAQQQAPQWFDHWQVNVRGQAPACYGGCQKPGVGCGSYLCPVNGGAGCGTCTAASPQGFPPTFACPVPANVPQQMPGGVITIFHGGGGALDGSPKTFPLVPVGGCPGGVCPLPQRR